MKWEYKVHYFGHMAFQSGLNELGAQGWEMVSYHIDNATMPGEQRHFHCVFKRILKGDPELLRANQPIRRLHEVL